MSDAKLTVETVVLTYAAQKGLDAFRDELKRKLSFAIADAMYDAAQQFDKEYLNSLVEESSRWNLNYDAFKAGEEGSKYLFEKIAELKDETIDSFAEKFTEDLLAAVMQDPEELGYEVADRLEQGIAGAM